MLAVALEREGRKRNGSLSIALDGCNGESCDTRVASMADGFQKGKESGVAERHRSTAGDHLESARVNRKRLVLQSGLDAHILARGVTP
ncbi:MAG TPA: hypothetical protein VJ802_14730 [Gemmatimonadaceae bacterium]|nr:hypothetical protein [Gemmatimonadaceae bacterium]